MEQEQQLHLGRDEEVWRIVSQHPPHGSQCLYTTRGTDLLLFVIQAAEMGVRFGLTRLAGR